MQTIRNERISTQVLIFMLLSFSLVVIIAFGIIFINLSIVSKFIDESQQLIQKKQMDQHLKIVTYLAELQVRSFIQRSETKLLMGNKLLRFIQTQEIDVQSPIQCLNKFEDEYAPNDTFCYGIFWNEKEPRVEMQNQFRQLPSLLSASLLMLDNDFGFSVTAFTKNELYSIWPGTVMENYRPSIRDWYKNHLNFINIPNAPLFQSYYSEPYIHYITHSTCISQTMSLYNQDQTVFGISSCQLDFQLILPQEFFTKIDALGFIFTKNGTLLIGDKQYENITYLRDTNIFDAIGQQQIIDQANGIKFDNNCTTLDTDLLCLKNRSSEEELVVSASLIGNEGELVLAIVMNREKDIEKLMKYNEQVQKKFNSISLSVILNSIYLLLGCVGLAIVMLLAIQYSIKNIYKNNNDRSYSKVQRVTKIKQNRFIFLNQTILKLNYAFKRLCHSIARNIGKKNITCQQIQQLTYPIVWIKLDCKGLRKYFKKLSNNQIGIKKLTQNRSLESNDVNFIFNS